MRIASLNVGILRGRSIEVVELMSRRGIDLCCIQVCRWRVRQLEWLKLKDFRHKCFWIGNDLDTEDVGVFLAEK